jgi:hypothetical protein
MPPGTIYSGVCYGRKMLLEGDPFHLLPLLFPQLTSLSSITFLDAIALPQAVETLDIQFLMDYSREYEDI